MTEILEKIEEFDNKNEHTWNYQAGFKITTNEQEITLEIDNSSQCCEQWGYFLTEDDTTKFIGATLHGIVITDTNRSNRIFEKGYDWDSPLSMVEPESGQILEHLDEGDVMFVDIRTSAGVLQFVAYNAHNGYYGHEASVKSKQLTHQTTL